MTEIAEEAILDSLAADQYDTSGTAIPVTIPIELGNGVKVVYTTRLGSGNTTSALGCSMMHVEGREDAMRELVDESRRQAALHRQALERVIGKNVSLVQQVHGNTVADTDELTEGAQHKAAYGVYAVDADSQVTTRKDIAIGVYTADCLPILLADPQASVIAAIHAGRKSLMSGVIKQTVERMIAKGAEPQRMVAACGPAICEDCYEVDAALADEFDNRFEGGYTLSRFGGPGINLQHGALLALLECGITATQVVDPRPRVRAATQYLREDEELAALCLRDGYGVPLEERLQHIRHSMCTMENPLWYSHRLASKNHQLQEGRMLSLIMMTSE